MKNNKIWYIGYLIGICGLILMFTIKLNDIYFACEDFTSQNDGERPSL